MLKIVLGDNEDIKIFDKLRQSYKSKKDVTLLKELRVLKAKLEVKIGLKNDYYRSKLKEIEMKALVENSNLSITSQNADDKKEKDDIIHKLKCIDYLGREFDITQDP